MVGGLTEKAREIEEKEESRRKERGIVRDERTESGREGGTEGW